MSVLPPRKQTSVSFAATVIGGMTKQTGKAKIYARCRTFVPLTWLNADQQFLPRAVDVEQTVATDLWHLGQNRRGPASAAGITPPRPAAGILLIFGDPVRQQSALLRITDLSQASRHVRKSGHERTSSRPIRSPRRRSPAALAAHCVDEQKRTRRCK
jgi:hypothetical protein